MRAWLVPIGLAICGSSFAFAEPPCDITGWMDCDLEAAVPSGCPIHVLARDGEPAIRAIVRRGARAVDVTGAITTASITRDVATLDYYTCDCHPITAHRKFTEITIALVGARAGEVVEVAGRHRAIGPAAACPPVAWPQTFVEPIACDLCPQVAATPSRDAKPPRDGSSGAAGCTSTETRSWFAGALLALGVVWIVVRSRR